VVPDGFGNETFGHYFILLGVDELLETAKEVVVEFGNECLLESVECIGQIRILLEHLVCHTLGFLLGEF